MKAAIRFEGASGKYSTVSNCVFHNGLGWGMSLVSSANIHISNNVVFSFKPFGVAMLSVRNITFDNNFVGGIYERDGDGLSGQNWADRRAGVTVCALLEANRCFDLHITNNIVAGAAYAGFVVPASDCTNPGDKFKDNVAHSVAGFEGGMGAVVYPDAAIEAHKKTCYRADSIVAYKCVEQGVHGFFEAKKVLYTNITSMDNVLGMGPLIKQRDFEYDELLAEVNDCNLFGETDIPDCPVAGNGDYCSVFEKYAVFPSTAAVKGKDPHISSLLILPMYKIKGDVVWGARTVWKRNKFSEFTATTVQGKRNSIIGTSHYQPDYTPMHEMYSSTFENVESGAIAMLGDPLERWANHQDCGLGFPCTGPKNVLFHFKDTTWLGVTPAVSPANFQVIHDNDGFAPFVPTCTRMEVWNGYMC